MLNRSGMQRIHVMQGEARVATGPDTVLTTLLGSCVAACIHDRVAGVTLRKNKYSAKLTVCVERST